MTQEDAVLAALPEPGESVFYPKVGHCIYRGITEDKVAPDMRLLELEDLEEGSRILIPVGRVPSLNLRAAGVSLDDIKEGLASEFEEPLESEEERQTLLDELITDGSPANLARALKRLHLLRQSDGLTREEELTRKKIRSWLAAEVSLSKDCTRAEAQAFITRLLQETMAAHKQKEKEEAKQRRRAAKEQKKAEEAAAKADAEAFFTSPEQPSEPTAPAVETEPVQKSVSDASDEPTDSPDVAVAPDVKAESDHSTASDESSVRQASRGDEPAAPIAPLAPEDAPPTG